MECEARAYWVAQLNGQSREQRSLDMPISVQEGMDKSKLSKGVSVCRYSGVQFQRQPYRTPATGPTNVRDFLNKIRALMLKRPTSRRSALSFQLSVKLLMTDTALTG